MPHAAAFHATAPGRRPVAASERHAAGPRPRETRAEVGLAVPARLTRPRGSAPVRGKFISLAQYEAGFANRDRWPVLWPHLHPRPQPRSHGTRPVGSARGTTAQDPPRQALRPALLARPVTAASVTPVQPGPSRPDHAPIPIASAEPSPSGGIESEPVARVTQAPALEATPPCVADPAPVAPADEAPHAVRIHPGVRAAAAVTAAAPLPSPRATAWQRVCANPGVQRALGVANLTVDVPLLLPAGLLALFTGKGALTAMVNTVKDDWHRIVEGQPVESVRPQPTQAIGAVHIAATELVSALTAARGHFRTHDAVMMKKEAHLRRCVWGRGLTFALSLLAIGASGVTAALNPAIGGVMTVISVYAARQAYANWRLARENLEAFRAGRSVSPMGSNAVAHAIYRANLDDPALAMTPAEAQRRAANAAVAVTAVSMAATAAVGGVTMATGVALPAVVSGIRHASRFVGASVAPAAEVASSYVTDAEIAQQVEQVGFDDVFYAHWETFFHYCPDVLARCKQAYAAYAGRDAGLRLQQGGVPQAEEEGRMHSALVRWTRETRQLGDLLAWLALDAAAPDGDHWTYRVFTELAAIEASRARLRGAAAGGAMTQAAQGIVALAV